MNQTTIKQLKKYALEFEGLLGPDATPESVDDAAFLIDEIAGLLGGTATPEAFLKKQLGDIDELTQMLEAAAPLRAGATAAPPHIADPNPDIVDSLDPKAAAKAAKAQAKKVSAILRDLKIKGKARVEMKAKLDAMPIEELDAMVAGKSPTVNKKGNPVSKDVIQPGGGPGSEEFKPTDPAVGQTPANMAPPVSTGSGDPSKKDLGQEKITQVRQQKLHTRFQNLLDASPATKNTTVAAFLKQNGIDDISFSGDFAKAEALIEGLTTPSGSGTPTGTPATIPTPTGTGSKGGKGGKASRPPTLKELPTPIAITERLKKLGVEGNWEDLLGKVPASKMPPGWQMALDEAITGNVEPLMKIIKGDAAMTTGDNAFDMKSLDAQVDEGLKVGDNRERARGLEGKLQKLKGKFVRPNENLTKVEAALQKAISDPNVKGKRLEQLLKAVPRTPGVREGMARQAAGFDPQELRADVAEQTGVMNRVGRSMEEATPEQLRARIEDVAKKAKLGDAAGVAAEVGAPASEGFGLKQLREGSLPKFLKNSKDPAIKKLLLELEQNVAGTLGKGAGGSRMASLIAKMGGPGKAGLNVGITLLPVLMELFGGMKSRADANRGIAVERINQAHAPSVQDLLARYRAQQFVEQGVNSAPPDPKILERFMRMGPKLTDSEVYIGPDRSFEHAQQMLQEMSE